MKYKIRYKALDATDIRAYSDQDYYELYSFEDLKDGEPVPQMLLDSPVIRERPDRLYIRVDYPVIDGVFKLDGTVGAHDNFVAAGKKAYVRGGAYKNVSIEQMSPIDYIRKCHELLFDGTDKTLDDLIDYKLNEYDVVKTFSKHNGEINYPCIDYNTQTQEGIHRALYALKTGLNSIPVIVIN